MVGMVIVSGDGKWIIDFDRWLTDIFDKDQNASK